MKKLTLMQLFDKKIIWLPHKNKWNIINVFCVHNRIIIWTENLLLICWTLTIWNEHTQIQIKL